MPRRCCPAVMSSDLHDVAVLHLAIALEAQLDLSLAAVVEHALEPLHLALDVGAILVRDGQVLASDRGSHRLHLRFSPMIGPA